MAYYGISSNLIIYLTTKLRQGTVRSGNNVTNWVGTIWITPIFGAYVADAHLGRYWTFVIASVIYLLGMSLLTLSVSLPSLKPPPCSSASTLHLAVFYGALYTLAIGTGGTKPNISTIGADQFDEFHPKEKLQKLSFFNWWFFSIFFGTLFANTVLVYIQDNVGWSIGYALPTLGLALSIAVFFAGTPFYRHKKLPSSSGSGSTPFSRMARVIVAAIRNSTLPLPSDPKHLYQLDLSTNNNKASNRIESTSTLKFLNKASIITNTWRVCTVTQVEETKQMIIMLPILLVTIIPSTMIAQVNTLFIKQGTTLDRHMGSHFQIPSASLGAFVTISMLISVVLYDRVFVKIMQRITKNPRGITLLQRMGLGLLTHVLIMLVASLTERYRLQVATRHGALAEDARVPLTIFVLLPQFVLMGCADALLEVAKIEFFYDQAPESMKSLGTSYSMTSLGLGNFVSSFLLTTVSRVTEARGHDHEGWIRDNLNVSHLDYYYAFFGVLNVLNLAIFLLIAKFYVYKAEVSDSIQLLHHQLNHTTPPPPVPMSNSNSNSNT